MYSTTFRNALVGLTLLISSPVAVAGSILSARRDSQAAADAVAVAGREAQESRRRIAEAEEAALAGQETLGHLQVEAQQLEAQALQFRRQREMVRVETEQLAAGAKRGQP